MADFEHLDYYELLGVARTASFDEIKRAYRREISKYHPDRFVHADAEQQAYASERSQRLTEAYGILSDLAARSAYNRGQSPTANGRSPRPSSPPQQRDYQAELYDKALGHMAAGRLLQAVGAFRQLQQINPFYRNSAELLTQLEAQLNQRAERPPRKLGPLFIVGGVAGGIIAVAAIAWAVGAGRNVITARQPTSAIGSIATGVTAQTALIPTAIPPTVAPPTTEPPTVAPPTTEPPTAAPPTVVPTVAAESGQQLVADSFSGPGWASLSGSVWQVGYQGGRYRVQGGAGSGPIWSYRAAPQADVSIGVDLQVTSGEGGLMVRFLDAGNYITIVLNPAQTSYRIEQHRGGAINVLAGGQTEAITPGTDAINRLVVRLQGAALQVFVNGQQIADVAANDPPDTARYGLMVIAKDTDAEAFFDNLQLRTLQ